MVPVVITESRYCRRVKIQILSPKFLSEVRGSGNNADKVLEEAVPISNSFQALTDDAMNEEYESSIWPRLRNDVDEHMETGIYPSKEIRADWSLKQMEYFYNNCHKFHLDPACEDDVDSETDGVAADMKPEFDVNTADALVNNSADNQDVSNDV